MKPVKIKSNLDLFDITWRIILRCNYDCWYCKTDWHTKNEGDTPDVDKYFLAMNDLRSDINQNLFLVVR